MRLDFGSYVELESPTAVLLEDLEHLLTAGTFVESDGFSLSGSGRTATISRQWLERAGGAVEANGAIDLWITWSRERARFVGEGPGREPGPSA